MVLILVQVIDAAISLYSLAIIARAFLPLVGADLSNPIVRFIFDITEPVLAPLRRFTIVGMWDLSPVAAIVLLMIVRQVLTVLAVGALR
jgi:YggT family protein